MVVLVVELKNEAYTSVIDECLGVSEVKVRINFLELESDMKSVE